MIYHNDLFDLYRDFDSKEKDQLSGILIFLSDTVTKNIDNIRWFIS